MIIFELKRELPEFYKMLSEHTFYKTGKCLIEKHGDVYWIELSSENNYTYSFNIRIVEENNLSWCWYKKEGDFDEIVERIKSKNKSINGSGKINPETFKNMMKDFREKKPYSDSRLKSV